MSHAADRVAGGSERAAKRRRGSRAIFLVRPLLIAAAGLSAYGIADGSWAAIAFAVGLFLLSLPLGIVLHSTAGADLEKADRRCG